MESEIIGLRQKVIDLEEKVRILKIDNQNLTMVNDEQVAESERVGELTKDVAKLSEHLGRSMQECEQWRKKYMELEGQAIEMRTRFDMSPRIVGRSFVMIRKLIAL